jgi:PAS domain S-box-containing protein
VNRALEQALGLSKDRIIGQTDHDLFAEPQARAYREQELQVIASKQALQREDVTGCAGEICHLLDTTFPLTDASGRVCGVGHISHDITALKHGERDLRGSQERLRVAVCNAAVLAAQCDHELRYRWVNCPPNSGFDAAWMIGKRDDELSDSRSARELLQLKQQVRESGNGHRGEIAFEYKGETRVYDILVEPLIGADESVVGVTSAAFEINERKHTEEALRGTNMQLREADQSKDAFLAMMVHELRNPLVVLSLATMLLANPNLDVITAQQQREVCERQEATLSRLVDDLLDFSRITRGVIRLQQQRVALDEVVHRAVDAVRSLLDGRQHTLNVMLTETSVSVIGDALRLEQVLVNLLMNAANYTDPGGCVGVTMQRVEGHVQFVVTDSGNGLEPQMSDRIFKLFGQGERALARAQGGLGVGLTVARHLVELHGGRIEARSQEPRPGPRRRVYLHAALGR